MKARTIPVATYRLQFNREFTFRQAAELVPYLKELGISHCYASPYLRARPGSTHGYDIIDHNTLNPEIGSREDFEHFVSTLHEHGMSHILDVVPNHMGVMGSDNAWWLDVLEDGEASVYAEYFDIDWEPIKEELHGKVLVPILADQYGNVLEAGDLKLTFNQEAGEFSIFYHQHRFPIDPKEYPRILNMGGERLPERLEATNPDLLELQSVATAFSHLPGHREKAAEKAAERTREKEVQKRRLAALCARSPEIREFINDNVRVLNGTVGDPRSFDDLHELIKAQAYRLAQWRAAADDINYRRFFDINDLAALRMENEAVFKATHGLVLKLVGEGKLEGLRIDHPDGLYDPAQYLERLQAEAAAASAGGDSQAKRDGLYVVVEKILTGEERLREDWPVSGTTGYEFTNQVNGLFVDHTAVTKIERLYHAFIGKGVDFDDLAYRCKKLTLENALASELNVLANLLMRIALINRHTCDFTLNSIRNALSKIIACFPVYRTYITGSKVAPEDQRYIEKAVTLARRRSTTADVSIFDFLRRVLLTLELDQQNGLYRRRVIRLAMKFQQVTSAVMAKGLEDTALYRYNRLISLNEVGGDPRKFGVTPEEFHSYNQQRALNWPHTMLSSSTHDSKRSEDVRARINVLSEIPAQWRLRLRRWRDWNRSKRVVVEESQAPGRNDEYLFYQTLVGTWPLERLDDAGWEEFQQRIQQFLTKAMREAKEQTSWVNPSKDYEGAMAAFIEAVLQKGGRNKFVADFSEFQNYVTRIGMLNGLSQTVLKLTSPGVPDIYQGNEVWDFSLVDPDNRRPVDYGKRMRLLGQLRECEASSGSTPEGCLRDLMEHMDDGRIKLYVTWKALRTRRECRLLFEEGGYRPLTVQGSRARHIVAFARQHEKRVAITVAPRLCAILLGEQERYPIGEIWGDTTIQLPAELAPQQYENVFGGRSIQVEHAGETRVIPVRALLAGFPVALMVGNG
ncbi:MAG TPA: malto-oligosyltrehalose synthase [Terriglobales bacterium]|nr:malto-oligosyltrehalose synthase [Terriglobales bacterium]